MSLVFWDTNLFSFMLRGDTTSAADVLTLRARHREAGDQIVTSALAVAETLVVAQGDPANPARPLVWNEAIRSMVAAVLPFDDALIPAFVAIRSRWRSIKAPDAIHLACAASAGCELFVTNDRQLVQLGTVSGVEVRALSDAISLR